MLLMNMGSLPPNTSVHTAPPLNANALTMVLEFVGMDSNLRTSAAPSIRYSDQPFLSIHHTSTEDADMALKLMLLALKLMLLALFVDWFTCNNELALLTADA